MRRRGISYPQNVQHSETEISDASGYSSNDGQSYNTIYGSFISNGRRRSARLSNQSFNDSSDVLEPRATSTPNTSMNSKEIPEFVSHPSINLSNNSSEHTKIEKSPMNQRQRKQQREALGTLIRIHLKDRNLKCGLGTYEYIKHKGVLTRAKCHKLYGNSNESGNLKMSRYLRLMDNPEQHIDPNDSGDDFDSEDDEMSDDEDIRGVNNLFRGNEDDDDDDDEDDDDDDEEVIDEIEAPQRRYSNLPSIENTIDSTQRSPENRRIPKAAFRKLNQSAPSGSRFAINRSVQTENMLDGLSPILNSKSMKSNNSSGSSIFLDDSIRNNDDYYQDNERVFKNELNSSSLTVTPIKTPKRRSNKNEVIAVVDDDQYFSITSAETTISKKMSMLKIKTKK